MNFGTKFGTIYALNTDDYQRVKVYFRQLGNVAQFFMTFKTMLVYFSQIIGFLSHTKFMEI